MLFKSDRRAPEGRGGEEGRRPKAGPQTPVLLGLALLVLLLAALTLFLLLRRDGEAEREPARATRARYFGVDLSSWQDPAQMNYGLLAFRLDFAILRLGYTGDDTGTEHKDDSAFAKHYTELSARRVPLGVYWYSCADTPEKGVAEAQAVLARIKGKKLHLPVFIDTEDSVYQEGLGRRELSEVLLAFCRTIEAAGYRAGIYANYSWFREQTDLERLRPYVIWLAHWDEHPPRGMPHQLQQISEEGRLPGYAGPLDLNLAQRVHYAAPSASERAAD